MKSFKEDLQSLINIHSKENGSDTPDFILARYLDGCLVIFDESTQRRDEFYGRHEVKKKSKKKTRG